MRATAAADDAAGLNAETEAAAIHGHLPSKLPQHSYIDWTTAQIGSFM